MRYIALSLLVILSSAVLYAAAPKETPPGEQAMCGSPLTFHQPMYFLFGNEDDQVKAQLSFKYDPFYAIFDNLGLYLAYTQLMNWRLYDESSPFRDINFNPEVFWRLESNKNIFNNIDLGPLDYFQLGIYEHKSNGKDGSKSRSMDRSYLQAQVSVGGTINVGMNLKVFVLYIDRLEEENRDIQQYIGSWEAMVFLKHRRGENPGFIELYARFGAGGGPGGFNFYKGWQEYSVVFPSLFTRVQPYIQVFHGYGEFMLDYNVKRTESWDGTFLHGTGTAIRAGVIIH